MRPGASKTGYHDVDLTRAQLRTLVRRGEVDRVGRGLYCLREAEPTEHETIAMVCKRAPEQSFWLTNGCPGSPTVVLAHQ